MQLSILHSFLGDKVVDFDTETPEGRKKLSETLNKLLRSGTAIFLERAEKTYRVTGWDPETDKLVIQPPGRWPTGEKKTFGPSHEEKIMRHGPSRGNGRRLRAGTRRGRMTAVAPTAGG